MPVEGTRVVRSVLQLACLTCLKFAYWWSVGRFRVESLWYGCMLEFFRKLCVSASEMHMLLYQNWLIYSCIVYFSWDPKNALLILTPSHIKTPALKPETLNPEHRKNINTDSTIPKPWSLKPRNPISLSRHFPRLPPIPKDRGLMQSVAMQSIPTRYISRTPHPVMVV